MTKKLIITIGGKPGSGKSTASKLVAARLGYEHFSSGDLFRAIARERGVDVHQHNLAAETEHSIDHEIDERLRDIGANQDRVAIDSRMAWHWMPESFKVYLDLDLETAAKRILSSIDEKRQEHEHIPDNPAEYAARLEARLASEAGRYKRLYGVDPYDTSNYDLVVDTSNYDSEQAVDYIINQYEVWLRDSSSSP
jgi:CMP/dCMP kinase